MLNCWFIKLVRKGEECKKGKDKCIALLKSACVCDPTDGRGRVEGSLSPSVEWSIKPIQPTMPASSSIDSSGLRHTHTDYWLTHKPMKLWSRSSLSLFYCAKPEQIWSRRNSNINLQRVLQTCVCDYMRWVIFLWLATFHQHSLPLSVPFILSFSQADT